MKRTLWRRKKNEYARSNNMREIYYVKKKKTDR